MACIIKAFDLTADCNGLSVIGNKVIVDKVGIGGAVYTGNNEPAAADYKISPYGLKSKCTDRAQKSCTKSEHPPKLHSKAASKKQARHKR